jgi:glycosyltransferase involved in cell wall biosynthesis
MTATVILPTTGSPELVDAIESVLNQTYDTQLYLVVDGNKHIDKVRDILGKNKLWNDNINFCGLPENVGANGFYGHRVYAAFTHLVNTKYVLYLDQDCWFDKGHVETLVSRIEADDLDWSYALRNICDVEGNFICQDNCESLGPSWPVSGYPHVDTNCYCIKTEVATKIAQVWHGGWGQDRVFLNVLSNNFKKFDTTGYNTVNYRVGGNEGSVKPEFFLHNNKQVEDFYRGVLPWRRT